jgi:hypothetical protein
MADVVDIDAARGDVGRHQHASAAVAEIQQGALPRGLRLVAVNGLDAEAAPREMLGNAVGAMLGAGEHEDARQRLVLQQSASSARLLPAAT